MEELLIRRPFKSGGSTAIRIPKSMHVELTDELEISSPREGVIVMKVVDREWGEKLKNLIESSESSGVWNDTEAPSREFSHRDVGEW
jgi:antitoxin component of MazEF toxin-antitoxin module